ncbi:MAG: hypothetical protein KGR98_10150 [Verrucomicrobia bacterium]|nr:hypothetical protein [Verrucomicrobiota bacterium]MDE3098058.1 hypothetical protein [Verrucomicrobiota bacterium]
MLAQAAQSSFALEPILQGVLARAKLEHANDRGFDSFYSYSCEKITEFRNAEGVVIKREDKTDHHTPAAVVDVPPAALAAVEKPDGGPVTATHSNVHGQAIHKKDLLLTPDLFKRFHFTLVGRQMFNGRPTWVVDFAPASKNLPEHTFKDRFINKAAGRVWVDAGDYALVKAQLHLTAPVEVGFGLIGAVWKFNYGFERERTPDGWWFNRNVDWHLEGREVVVKRIVDYREETSGLRPVSALALR